MCSHQWPSPLCCNKVLGGMVWGCYSLIRPLQMPITCPLSIVFIHPADNIVFFLSLESEKYSLIEAGHPIVEGETRPFLWAWTDNTIQRILQVLNEIQLWYPDSTSLSAFNHRAYWNLLKTGDHLNVSRWRSLRNASNRYSELLSVIFHHNHPLLRLGI